MYYVEMIRFADGRVSAEGLPPVEPDLETVAAAIEAGHRVFASRGQNASIAEYPSANGFRVKARGSEKVLHVWTKGDPNT